MKRRLVPREIGKARVKDLRLYPLDDIAESFYPDPQILPDIILGGLQCLKAASGPFGRPSWEASSGRHWIPAIVCP